MLVKRTKTYEKQINNTARQVDIHVVTINENWKNSDWRTMENVFINIRKPDAFHVESKINTVEMELTPCQQTLPLSSWSVEEEKKRLPVSGQAFEIITDQASRLVNLFSLAKLIFRVRASFYW